MTTNMKPADELLTLRQKIKQLQKREEELKAGLLDGTLQTDGDFAIVHLVKRATSRFDRKAAEAEVGSLSQFDVKGESVAVNVSELAQPEDI